MPIPASIGQHYDVEPEQYWNSIANDPAHFVGQLARLRSLVGSGPDRRALDVGSGLGQTMLALERAGFKAVGLEPSKTFAERARQLHGFAADQLVVSSLEDATLPPASFDFVNFGAVLEHLVDPRAALGKAAGWLRPGGLIHAEVPSARWLVCRLANAFYRMTGTSFVGNLSPLHRPFHLYEFTLEAFQRCCEPLGLEIAHSEVYVCQTYLPRVLDPPFRALMRLTGTGMQLAVWLRKP